MGIIVRDEALFSPEEAAAIIESKARTDVIRALLPLKRDRSVAIMKSVMLLLEAEELVPGVIFDLLGEEG